jgi:hypothetical protein
LRERWFNSSAPLVQNLQLDANHHLVRPAKRRQLKSCKHAAAKEVIFITSSTALLIVAVVSATMAFATLVLKIVEVSRKK